MTSRTILLCCALCVCVGAAIASSLSEDATFTSTRIEGPMPAKDAHIVKHWLGKAAPGSKYETGDLHILYSDGTQVVGKMAKKKPSPDSIFDQVGIDDVKVAADRRTIGWEEMSTNCCTSYSIPESLAIYRSGRSVLHIQQGQTIWYWTFRDGGRRVAVVWGATHGPQVGDFQLIDVKAGRLIAEVYGDPNTQALDSDAPKWAKQAQWGLNHQ